MYWIYENFPTKRATLHRANCGFCNSGAGTRRSEKSDAFGRWIGPLDSLDAARQAAGRLTPLVYEHTCVGRDTTANPSNVQPKFQLEDVNEATLSLFDLFHRRMLQIYVTLRDELDYRPIRFLRSVRRHGGVGHAKRSLRRPAGSQAGLQFLRDHNRLELSLEAHVCDPTFHGLFTPEEIEIARARLK